MRHSDERSFLNSRQRLSSCIEKYLNNTKELQDGQQGQMFLSVITKFKVDVAVNYKSRCLFQSKMKSKTNFTYKEFIQQMTQSPLSKRDNNTNISPHKNNAGRTNKLNMQKDPLKPFYQKNLSTKNLHQGRNPAKTPRTRKQNNCALIVGNKCFRAKNLQLKQKNKNRQNLKTERSNGKDKFIKSVKESADKYFGHNQSQGQGYRFHQSCAIFQCQQNQEEALLRQKKHISFFKNHSRSIDNAMEKDVQTQRQYQRIKTDYGRGKSQYKAGWQNNPKQPTFYNEQIEESLFSRRRTQKDNQKEYSRCQKSQQSLFQDSYDKRIEQSDSKIKSCQYIYNKFITNLTQILVEITKIHDHKTLLQHKVKYIEYLECLKELKLIKNDYQPYSQDIDLVRDLWEQLIMGHNVNHLVIILAIIIKVAPLECIDQKNTDEIQNYLRLQKKYAQFRYTQLQLTRLKKHNFSQNLSSEKYSFQPQISAKSKELAEKSYSKKKNLSSFNKQSNQKCSRGALTSRQNNSVHTEFDHSYFYDRQGIQSPTGRSISPLGNRRSDILYEQAKKKSKEKREDKSTIDYEFERNEKELTFKPKITIKRKKNPQCNDHSNVTLSTRCVPDEQKVITRMITGRIERQVRKEMETRGLPYNETVIEKIRKEKFDQVIKEHQEASLKSCSKVKLNVSHSRRDLSEEKSSQSHLFKSMKQNERCTTQVEKMEKIVDLSFQGRFIGEAENLKEKQNNSLVQLEQRKKLDEEEKFPAKQERDEDFNVIDNPDQSPEDFFILDIYIQEDRCEKLLIRRDASLDEVNTEAEKFVKKHNLPSQMEQKLKNQLSNAMKFHSLQKIEQNQEQEECSLIM